MTALEPITVGDLTIVEAHHKVLSEDEVVAFNTFSNVMGFESHPEDPRTPVDLTRVELKEMPDFIFERLFWALDRDGAIAGISLAAWQLIEENRHAATLLVQVRPDMRRRGLAKALLRPAVDVITAEGRALALGWTSERVPAGEAFAKRIGAQAVSAIHTNRLMLEEVDRELIRKWIDDGPIRAEGYSLVAIDERYPDDVIDQVAKVYDVMNTAPRDDMDLEDVHHTPEQLREWERTRESAGTTRWSLFARHDASAELVGLSEIYYNPASPETMFQGDTGVDPGHRGHAIGKWMKAKMIERILAERPEIVDIRTGNADSNDAMLGINGALGFRPYTAQTTWQVPLENLRAYLAGSST
jgi:mycothiol synthase